MAVNGRLMRLRCARIFTHLSCEGFCLKFTKALSANFKIAMQVICVILFLFLVTGFFCLSSPFILENWGIVFLTVLYSVAAILVAVLFLHTRYGICHRSSLHLLFFYSIWHSLIFSQSRGSIWVRDRYRRAQRRPWSILLCALPGMAIWS